MSISPAPRFLSVKPSCTVAISDKAAKLRAAGKDIISLSVGEPDFDTPQNVKDAANAAMKAGQTKYTALNGTVELRTAVSKKFERENNLSYPINQIIVTNGAKQAIFNAILATVGAGDEVIIPAPYWVSYPEMVALSEGKSVIIQCPAEDGFKLRSEALEKAITPKTKWLILNSPSNPTGAVYTKEELQALADVLLKHPHVYILADDIYEHLIYDNVEFYSIAQVEPKLIDRTLTVNGLSKSHAMTGWRIGFAGGPAEIIGYISAIQSHSTTNACSISQAAAVEALNGPQDFLKEWLASFRERRDFVVGQLSQTKGLTCLMPKGAFYVFVGCAGLIGKTSPAGVAMPNDETVVLCLLEEAEVAAVPGAGFGLSPYFRISYATSMAKLEEACKRIKRFCEACA